MKIKKIFFKVLIALFLFAAGFILHASSVSAQSFRYPVAELGFCRDAKECYLYCQIEENKPACWSYGKYILEEQVLGVSSDEDKKIEEEAKKLGITFPIGELGNCGSASECRAYCDVEANRNTCQNFARSKKIGQYKDEGQMLEAAKEKLGCDSYESCRNFCENPANQNKCEQFGEEHAPQEFKQRKEEFLKKAKEVMGCNSFESCRNFCDNPVNRDSCQKFADEHMPQEFRQRHEEMRKRLERGEQRGGPGGCNSEESCRKYCEDPAHKDECRGPGGGSEEFRGGRDEGKGCSNEGECRSMCEQNPDKCPGFRQGQEQEKRQQEESQRRFEEQQRNQQQIQYQQYQPQNYQPPQGGSYPSPEQYQQKQSQPQYQPPPSDTTQQQPPQESFQPPPPSQ